MRIEKANSKHIDRNWDESVENKWKNLNDKWET